ncbi:hypothetical protein Bca52824_064835 [Brassica carinata]|uniref:Uncharacterized protein n=1 Tax=Brassica carinata TaxID=52824 RepID=A0A8X7QKI4_BRACI|nr:hypothetical protein Bca52824_064835 [Brassica carinata]
MIDKCVTLWATKEGFLYNLVCHARTGTGVKEKERVNIDLNKEPCDSSNVEEGEVPDINLGDFANHQKVL